MTLIIDPQVSGVAGNMFIGALIDLGAPSDKIKEVIENYATEFGKITVNIDKKTKNSVMTTYVNIQCEDNKSRHYTEIINKIDEITKEKYNNDITVKKSVELAKKVFKTLALAESEVHDKSIEELHFHEVGCADAVADIIGSCYAYHLLKLDESKVYSLPIATGYGSVKTQHGILPVPAPAVINILKNVPTTTGLTESELATPTGCAILVNITDEYIKKTPVMTIKKVGYGAGKKDLPTLNALRLIISKEDVQQNTITVLETNVDTLTGEVLGSLYDKLLKVNARDVTITPTIMKKNRPGHIIKVIVRNEDINNVMQVLMEETGTLGVRIIPQMHRGVATRENITHKITINGITHQVRFKIGYVDNKIIKCTPEFDDIKKLSDKTLIPIKDLMQLVEQEYKNYLRGVKHEKS